VQWLYDWWERIDSWITENRPGDAAAPATPPATPSATPPDETTATAALDM
jgi:hypothetical protein